MGMIGETLSIERPDNGTCDAFWGKNKCPNLAAFILCNRTNAGFAIMCDVHAAGFQSDYPELCNVLAYSPEKVSELTERARIAAT